MYNYLQKYKLIYLLFAVIITVYALSNYVGLVEQYISIKYDWTFELMMVFGQILFQWCFLFRTSFSEKWLYIYHLMTVSLIGSSLLCVLLLIHVYYPVSGSFALFYFFSVVIYMFLNHKQRVTKLHLPSFISYTWILYRLLILIFIVKYP